MIEGIIIGIIIGHVVTIGVIGLIRAMAKPDPARIPEKLRAHYKYE